MSQTPEFDELPTKQLLGLRQRMIEGNERVGILMVQGKARGEAMEGVHMRAALVERVDASLLRRGVNVPPPFWLE